MQMGRGTEKDRQLGMGRTVLKLDREVKHKKREHNNGACSGCAAPSQRSVTNVTVTVGSSH